MRYAILALILMGFLQAQTSLQEKKKSPMPVVKKPLRVIIHPKCMVCGQLADRDTLWMQEIDLKNGARFFFDGTLHAFLFYFNPEKYSKETIHKEDLGRFIVREFATGKKVSADSVVYLVDSRLEGPNGLDLVPLFKDNAKKFKKQYGGKIKKFSEITAKFIEKYAKKGEKKKYKEVEEKEKSKE